MLRILNIQLLTTTRDRDFNLSAPAAPEQQYRKFHSEKGKSGDLHLSAPVGRESKGRDLNETWPRLQFVGARSPKAMWPRLKRGGRDKRHPL